MKTIFLLLILSCFNLFLAGQNNGVTIQTNDKGIVEYVKFSYLQSSGSQQVKVPETANEFFAEYLRLTPSTTFVLQPQKQRNKDFIHEHYDQYCNGIKVDGAGYNFHFEKGRMYFAHGNYIEIEGLNTIPSITEEKAKQALCLYKDIPVEEVTDFKADLLIKEISEISEKDTVYSPVLVYRVYLITGHPNNNEIGYIDAQSEKVLLTEPSMTGYSATGTFETRYNGTRQASTQRYNNTYNLCDSSRNAIIHTWDLNGSTNINNRVELTDNNNNWTAAEHASSEDDMGLDIHWALQEIYDYFFDEYSINGFDNGNTAITAYFHYGTSNDDKDNAYWNLNLNVLLFGDGAVKFSPVASLDAVAHEYGHGITDFQIGWAYSGDGAAFHEGMSDIWAVILENRISPNSIWKIGEEIILNYDCLRNIQVSDDPNAETEISDTYLSSTYNAGNHYVKSGVFSHWFYLLVNGGSGTNGIGNDYTVYGVGMDAVEDLIVEAVINNYLDNTTTYPQIRTAMVNAAQTLCSGQNGVLVQQVENAWYAVGVGTQPTQAVISGPSLVCSAGASFTINNLPQNATITWNQSSNLSRSSAQGSNPCTFVSTGSGEGWISATISNSCGSATLSQKTVWAGTQMASQINPYDVFQGAYVDVPLETGTLYEFRPLLYNPSSSSSDYYWEIEDEDENIYLAPPGTTTTFTAIDPGYYTVSLTYNNGCGWGSVKSVDFLFQQFLRLYLIITPNPTAGEATIAIKSGNEAKMDDDTEWDLEVYDQSQIQKVKKTRLKGHEYTLNTSDWREGVYIISVNYNSELLTGKLVVKK